MVDLDRFKQVNDTFGHPTGDDILVRIAQRLQAIDGEERELWNAGVASFVDKCVETRLLGALQLRCGYCAAFPVVSLAMTLTKWILTASVLRAKNRLEIASEISAAFEQPTICRARQAAPNSHSVRLARGWHGAGT